MSSPGTKTQLIILYSLTVIPIFLIVRKVQYIIITETN